MVWEEFQRALEGSCLPPDPTTKVVVALSGGMDSAVLAHLFARYAKEVRPGLSLILAHFNHRLRGEASDADEAFCRGLAGRLGRPFASAGGDVRVEARRRGLSLEEAARRARYDFLHAVCRRENASVLAIGHHADDQAETVLMNLLRGSGVLGLAGMPRVLPGPVRTIRPLLDVFRFDIAEYAEWTGVAFRHDESNEDTRFFRNRLRRLVLPALEKTLPSLKDHLLRIAALAQRLWRWIEPEVDRQIRSLAEEDSFEGIGLPVAALEEMHPSLRAEVLRACARRLLGKEKGDWQGRAAGPLSSAHLSLLENFISSGHTGRALSFPKGIRAAREYGRLRFCREDGAAMEIRPGFPIMLNRVEDLPQSAAGLVIAGGRLNPEEARPHLGRSSQEAFFDLERLAFPLRIRRPQPGDRFQLLGMTGTTLLSDLFTNLKVPQNGRRRALVVEDRQGIVWVWPYRTAERVKISPETREALRLTIRPDEPPSPDGKIVAQP
ncbi:MAG: tRNA lysidine(34) synthetase TilS [Planctomycetota bacterium]